MEGVLVHACVYTAVCSAAILMTMLEVLSAYKISQLQQHR